MKTRLLYIELKSGCSDCGPAWIARAETSKSGRTVYFNGRALKRGQGIGGNHFDVETGEEYWVSGVKRTGTNRHWAGSGQVMVDHEVVSEYLALTGKDSLGPVYRVVDVKATNKERFNKLENE